MIESNNETMNSDGKISGLLASARIANVPSVMSNTWLGIAMGFVWHKDLMAEIPWMDCLRILTAAVLLYISGNFLNDWKDRAWDATHRPERALPRKLFSSNLYLSLAVCLGTMGVAMARMVSLQSAIAASVIVGLIIIYTVFHKQASWAVIPMGLCRGMLPIMGILAFYPSANGVLPVSCGLLCYIMGLSLSARYEAMAQPPRRVAGIARSLLLATVGLAAWGNHLISLTWAASLAGALPYLAWTGFSLKYRCQPVPRLVSSLLAGIPLVDWIVLLPLAVMLAGAGIPGAQAVALLCFAVPPCAFIFALFLQRLTPAT